MIRKKLKELTEMIDLQYDSSKWAEVECKGVTIDSRKIEQGNLFIPFKGERVDGHQYVEAAIKAGASAALWQSDVPNPPKDLPVVIVEDTLFALQELARAYRNELNVKVVGITGSNGKTTTKDIMANLLSLKYKVHKTEGNYNNHIGLPLTILQLEETTEFAVLEMGMSARGEIDFLTRLGRPHAVIITNIGESHLLDLGSREGIAEAKLEIIDGLQDNGLLVYNGDEPLLRDPIEKLTLSAVIRSFGKNKDNNVFPTYIEQSNSGSTFKVNDYEGEFSLPVLGTHNVLNSLAAMTTARFFGVPYELMNAGFSKLRLTNMRMELVEGAKGEKIINDAYNASPTSMKAAIELVSNLPEYDQKILVLGDMLELGPEEETFHYEIGAALDPEKITHVFAFGKLAGFIAKGAETALGDSRVKAYDNKETLISDLKKIVNSNTLVMVKGSRGMKLEEVVFSLQSNS